MIFLLQTCQQKVCPIFPWSACLPHSSPRCTTPSAPHCTTLSPVCISPTHLGPPFFGLISCHGPHLTLVTTAHPSCCVLQLSCLTTTLRFSLVYPRLACQLVTCSTRHALFPVCPTPPAVTFPHSPTCPRQPCLLIPRFSTSP